MRGGSHVTLLNGFSQNLHRNLLEIAPIFTSAYLKETRLKNIWNVKFLHTCVFSGEAMFLLFCILHLLLFQNIISPEVTSPKQLWNIILAMIALQSTLVTQGEESKERDGEAANAGSSPLGQMEKRSNKGALPCLISWAINNNFAFFRSQISSWDPQGRKQCLHIQFYESYERK